MCKNKLQAIFPCLNFYKQGESTQDLKGFLTICDKESDVPFMQGECILFKTSRSYYLRLFYIYDNKNMELTIELGLLLNAQFSESILKICSEFDSSYVKENYKTKDKTSISEIVLAEDADLGLAGFARESFNALLIRISNAKRLKTKN